MATAQKMTTEFSVRVPKMPKDKRFSIMKFGDNLNIEVENWANSEQYHIYMEREDNRKILDRTATSSLNAPQFGEGSIYGSSDRYEQRRKKYGRSTKGYQQDNQPWVLTVEGRETRQFKGRKADGAGEHSDYWVFRKAGDGLFHAFKVDDWYNFHPIATHAAITDVDEAEERFKNRNKVINQFALVAQIKADAASAEGQLSAGKTATATNDPDDDVETPGNRIKITDRDEYESSNDSAGDADDTTATRRKKDAKTSKKKVKSTKQTNKAKTKKKKKKRRFEVGDDDVAALESEDGEEEGKEVDYMSSDSGSDNRASDDETREVAKLERQLVGVDVEKGLSKMMTTDDDPNQADQDESSSSSSSSEDGDAANDDENDDDVADDLLQRNAAAEKTRETKEMRRKLKDRLTRAEKEDDEAASRAVMFGEKDSDSGSDSDDPDKVVETKSALFLPKQRPPTTDSLVENDGNTSISASSVVVKEEPGAVTTKVGSSGRKRTGESNNDKSPVNKKTKREPADEKGPLTEAMVRKYLSRKPHTTKELVAKFRKKCEGMNKNQIVAELARILKNINPKKQKKFQEKKEVLYFSLNE